MLQSAAAMMRVADRLLERLDGAAAAAARPPPRMLDSRPMSLSREGDHPQCLAATKLQLPPRPGTHGSPGFGRSRSPGRQHDSPEAGARGTASEASALQVLLTRRHAQQDSLGEGLHTKSGPVFFRAPDLA